MMCVSTASYVWLCVCMYLYVLLVMFVCRSGSCPLVYCSVLSHSAQRSRVSSWTVPTIGCLLQRQQDEFTRSTVLTRFSLFHLTVLPLSALHAFDAIGWMTRRKNSCSKNSPKIYFWGNSLTSSNFGNVPQ